MDYEYEDDNSAWRPYRKVAERRRDAAAELKRQRQQGNTLYPIQVTGRKIAQSFWGQAWCQNLEAYHDYEYRLPSGRTYLRTGSVIDLQIAAGVVQALVKGNTLYQIEIKITPVDPEHWSALKQRCAGQVESMMALLAGQLPEAVMHAVTDLEAGLFPKPDEIKFSCTCLDWADMCKHVAAALYGVGVRVDDEPELLFTLRGVSSSELVAAAVADLTATEQDQVLPTELADDDLGALFGIDLLPPS